MPARQKLTTGDMFPRIELLTVQDEPLVLPDHISTDYAIVLFYRGHWCPFCRRVLAEFSGRRDEFAEFGFSIYAGAADDKNQATEVAKELSFPVAFDVSLSDAEVIGAWWNEDRGGYIQPSEFILSKEGRVLASTYSNSPIGRMSAAETLALAKLILS